MENIFYEKILNRIIQGRLRFSQDGLVLFIQEPSKDLIEESFDIYDETYKDAYFKGVYVKEELKEILFYNELWSPSDDKEAEKIEKQIEELKVEAFKNFYKPRDLGGIKINIRMMENQFMKYKSKLYQLDHISCEGVANFARSIWILSKTIYDTEKRLYDFQKRSLNFFLEYYNINQITQDVHRHIARTDPFRSMWNCSKKSGNIFGKPACEFSKDQLALCSYATMYDNVYESSESPHEDVIKDDDCLDGWFIEQRREHEKYKKKKELDSLLKNSKIANSQEVFLMAGDKETAQKISSMNTAQGNAIIQARNQQIDQAGSLKFTDLADVRQDIAMQAASSAIGKIKGK